MYILKKKNIAQTLEGWLLKFDVVAPVKVENFSQFLSYKPGCELALNDPHNTRFPPKSIFLPQSEVLHKYNQRLDKLTEAVSEYKPQVLFGVRPCDAEAFTLLDSVFINDDYKDPYWESRRNSTIVIGLGCTTPCQTCFCTTVGYGPFGQHGLDALISEFEDSFFIEVFSKKADELFNSLQIASEELENKIKSMQKKVSDSMTPAFETKDLKQKLDHIFDSDYWSRIAESCLGCGICTFLCPTCFCFDIVDEIQRKERVRNWDTCMFRIYSQEASGHNPRPNRKERTRQRLMHKFSYWFDHIGKIGCTGCGRCVRYCPVGLDIRQMIRSAITSESEVANVR